VNIIFIMSDSFRYDHLGISGAGKCRTPNLDKLAGSSHVFQNAYLSSFPTVPNRWDIFTGRLNHTYAKWQPLPAKEVVLSQVLGEGGYTTMMVADTPHILQAGFNFQRGFDAFEWIRGQENDHWKTYPPSPELPCSKEKLRSPEYTVTHYLRNTSWWQGEDDCFVSRTMNTAVEWLERNHDQGEFFLYIDTFDPHEPWDAPESYNAKYVDPDYQGEKITYPQYFPASYYEPEEIRFMQGRYAAEANLVDTQVGKVLDSVQRLGLADETAIIFTADHGYCLGDHGIVAKSIISSGASGYFESVPFYDEISHIPLMVRLPGQQERKDHFGLVQSIDMMPTVLELAEVIKTEIVKGSAKVQTIQCGFYQEEDWSVDIDQLHGQSLVPILREEIQDVRDFTVSSASLVSHSPREAKTAIRTADWKLIFCGKKVSDRYELGAPNFPPNRSEGDYVVGENKTLLFDLSKDPEEKRNVIEDNLDVAKDLHKRYVEFLVDKGTSPDLLEKHKEFVLTP
jgi:arylsulfatase A-like enzyme